jgi:hypothetical protein
VNLTTEAIMTLTRSNLLRAACAALTVAAAAGTFKALAAPIGCEAEVRGEFRRDQLYDDYIDKYFLINVTSPADCAKVYFDFITTEQLFNGETITSTRREWRKTTAEPSKASALKYRIARDSTLVKWEVKLADCVLCGTD